MRLTKLHGYTLQKSIGKGGMAEVWYAENSIGKIAAIKVLNKEFSANQEIVKRFESEARIMVSLNHPNIRKVYNFGMIGDQPAIVMEYLEGEDLSKKISKPQNYTNTEIIKWWNEAVSALNHTHSKGVIHRDIKPSNLFITKEGGLKILDFGIAKVSGGVTLTQTGQTMGTLLYMSPEQVKDSKHIIKATDAYSLAVSFAQLISRKMPYGVKDDDSSFEIQLKIVQQELDTETLPTLWKKFLEGFLQKEYIKRSKLTLIVIQEKTTHRFNTNKEKTVFYSNEKKEVKMLFKVEKNISLLQALFICQIIIGIITILSILI